MLLVILRGFLGVWAFREGVAVSDIACRGAKDLSSLLMDGLLLGG
jgi:hypothetical protein